MPPTLNSKALAAVKSFPESDKTYLVFGKGTIHSVSQIFQDPGLPDEVAQDIDAKFQDKLVYRVFEVDMIRVKWGETHNVFRSVRVVLCSAEDSHEKNLLSTFVAACLEPEGKTYLDTPAPADGSRPKKVLFATSPCAKHPQIRTFMAMMGCKDIDVADSTVLQLLEQQPKTAMKKVSPFSKKATPHLYDHAAGNQCGKCGKVGPSLKKCSCGKAYYCSKECQADQRRSHRADHNKAMKKDNKKSSKKMANKKSSK
ncbi:expressed unknown protein [Seminavis robusta]|uniref:MYND-type domain-containing protein n=1 Tax=Seminavis robusta TaxID=568900 RepID=A0A9N8EV32_9STRA|nr:expressed unknown protein [Seminavis robusta]|eukprot:Sro2305_g322610.1 n/a (256) ;mRNA; r:1707-2474